MNNLLKELYKSKRQNYYRLCTVMSVIENIKIEKNKRDLVESILRDAEAEYLDISDNYYNELSYEAEQERRKR